MSRDLDLVLFGATGYVGELTAAYLAQHAPSDVRIGLAGRSRSKLEAVRRSLGVDWPLLVADTGDAAGVTALAASATAIATTVGPYARYGLPLVQACAEAGTHYADLTGEVLFHRETIDRFHDVAVASGARIVPSCGYDSIPSDLAVLLLAEEARAEGAGDLREVTLVASLKGGVSGGTVDSMRAQIDCVKGDPARGHVVEDLYALSPDRAAEPRLDEDPDGFSVRQHGRVWTGPFVMAQYNTRVVRRSNALQDWAYGRELRYTERMAFGGGLNGRALATVAATGLRLAQPALRFGPSRAVADRVLPKPGKGPSEKARNAGFFRMDVDATTSTGATYRAVIAAQGDPGYAATAVMLGESGLCLAVDELSSPAGLLTPAVAMGSQLVDRLRKSGFEIEVGQR